MSPIFIVGQTATGKTALALEISLELLKLIPNTLGISLLSADSKQVYTGMDIVVGKDIPRSFQRLGKGMHTFYENGKIRIYGIDLVLPNQEWSVAHFVSYAKTIIEKEQAENRIVIIVGGTGMYIESLFNEPGSLFVQRNEGLRQQLETLSVFKLQELLQNKNAARYEAMNNSDRNNPRRLIRAIEVANAQATFSTSVAQQAPVFAESLFLGLHVSSQLLSGKIKQRVLRRFNEGAVEEYEKLIEQYPNWTKEARSALGYPQIQEYVQGKISRQECIQKWYSEELKYAKRQSTWFAKRTQIEWFDCGDTEVCKTNMVERIKNWYTASTK